MNEHQHDEEAAKRQRCNCQACCDARKQAWDIQRAALPLSTDMPKVIPTTCTYDPKTAKGAPLGMYHCPLCGEMVLAGAEHPGTLE